MRTGAASFILMGALAIAGGTQGNAAQAADPSAAARGAPPPDVGHIGQIHVSTQGTGVTPEAAVQDALRLAVMEVNGESIDSASLGVRFGLDLPFLARRIPLLKKIGSVEGAAFADAVASRSRGRISSVRLLRIVEPRSAGQPWKAEVEASIARFVAPPDARKIRIAVAPLRVPARVFDIGGTGVPASRIAAELRQHLIDALSASGRFTVVDRDFGPEVRSELDLIAAGQTPGDEHAKLGQTSSADLVWAGTINEFGYHRNARHLPMADRDLVSYSGGWSVSHRLVNVATRQIMLSGTLQEQVEPAEPTTMDRGVDGVRLAAGMESAVIDKAVAAILARTFPIVVVSREGGDVILSQGGRAVRAGVSYAVVSLGRDLKDPQTGESLGRAETPCCDVVIDRVSNRLAYGHLADVRIPWIPWTPPGCRCRRS